jgi:hypothetical protein
MSVSTIHEESTHRPSASAVLHALRRMVVLLLVTAAVTAGTVFSAGVAHADGHKTFQGDCGRLTCTVRVDRAQTRNARDAGGVIGIAAGVCGVFSAGTLAIVCGGAIAPAAGVIALAANRYYEQGDCLAIKFTKPGLPGPQLAWPASVKRGTRNCE